MVKRSITDEEIALIKAMRMRGMKAKDIQFLFNRPDRPVNTGRIRDIEKGDYGPSDTILEASGVEVDKFIAGFSPVPISASVIIPRGLPAAPTNPIDPAILRALFKKDGELWRLKAGESDEHECKAAFGFRHPGKWLRAIAALANNRGGYLIFGVHDRDGEKSGGVDLSYAVIGMATAEFEDADTVKITEHLKATFDPTPRIQKASLELHGKQVGVIYVDAHPSRPVIATRQSDDIREGDIFYRYPAQSSRIKYSDLRALLDARDAQARRQLLPLVEKLIELGPEKVLLADLHDGALSDGKRIIQLDSALVERLKFIKEGEFSEKDGAPTLKLIGEVQSEGEGKNTKKGFISQDDLFAGFLAQELRSNPKDYIRAGVEGAQADWVPVHYFANRSGMTEAETVEFVRGCRALKKGRKSLFVGRVQGRTTAHKRAAGAGLSMLQELESGRMPNFEHSHDAVAFGAAVQGLTAKPDIDLKALLAKLAESFAARMVAPGVMSSLRRAICRVDELWFGPGASAETN